MRNKIAKGLGGLALMWAASDPASATTIIGYDIHQAAKSGAFTGWTNTYNGTITPTAGLYADYAGGTLGSLNNGVVPASAANNQYMCAGTVQACDYTQPVGAPNIVPTITLYLDGLNLVSSIDILSKYRLNYASGNLASMRVTIGGFSSVIAPTRSGLLNPNGIAIDLNFALTGVLSTTPTNKIVLSDFVSANLGSTKAFGLGEVVVNGAAYIAPTVPEPASWAMMIGGFAAAGAAMRRGRFASAKALATA